MNLLANREIKFRAWAKEQNKMLVAGDGEGIHLKHFFDECDDLPIMQYTGLKDKNDVEIYEGDIVFSTNTFEIKKAKVLFIQGSFMCEWLNDDCYSEEMSRLIWNHRPYSVNGEMFEVIGNIYENPELLGDAP